MKPMNIVLRYMIYRQENILIHWIGWNQQYKSADDYIEDLLAENIDSECVSPKGNYTVDGFNMLLYTSVYPKEFIDFLDTEGFSGYTPVYKYEKGRFEILYIQSRRWGILRIW